MLAPLAWLSLIRLQLLSPGYGICIQQCIPKSLDGYSGRKIRMASGNVVNKDHQEKGRIYFILYPIPRFTPIGFIPF